MSRSKASKLFAIPFIATILVDQSSKILAEQNKMVIYNSGVSLGLFTLVPRLFLSLTLLVLLVLVGWAFRSIWQQIPLAGGLFFGGGVSNLVDRFLVGSVRDWLSIPLMTIHNNLADYAIALGLLSMIVMTLRKAYEGEVVHEVTHVSNDSAELREEDT